MAIPSRIATLTTPVPLVWQGPVFLSTPPPDAENHPRSRKPALPAAPSPTRLRSATPTSSSSSSARRNFVEANKHIAPVRPRSVSKVRGPFRSPEEAARPESPKEARASFGKLPAYLVQRKIEHALAREAKEKEAERRRLCPPGKKLVPEPKARAVVAQLQAEQASIQAELARLPLAASTPSALRRRAELDGRAREVQRLIATYSRKKVVVPESEPLL